MKKLYKILTHLDVEYRHATSARQAKYIVYLEYVTYGYKETFQHAAQDWDASEV